MVRSCPPLSFNDEGITRDRQAIYQLPQIGPRNLRPRLGHVSHLIFQHVRLCFVAAEAFPLPRRRVLARSVQSWPTKLLLNSSRLRNPLPKLPIRRNRLDASKRYLLANFATSLDF